MYLIGSFYINPNICNCNIFYLGADINNSLCFKRLFDALKNFKFLSIRIN